MAQRQRGSRRRDVIVAVDVEARVDVDGVSAEEQLDAGLDLRSGADGELHLRQIVEDGNESDVGRGFVKGFYEVETTSELLLGGDVAKGGKRGDKNRRDRTVCLSLLGSGPEGDDVL